MRFLNTYTLFVITLILRFNTFYCQNLNIDSLKIALKNATHDTSRCLLLNQLTENFENKEWHDYNQQLLILAKKNSESTTNKTLKHFYLKQFASALNNIGFEAQEHGDVKNALDNFQKSLSIREQIQDKDGIANSYNEIGTIYNSEGNVPKALEYFQKSLTILKETQDKVGLGYILNNIGLVYSSEGNIEKALEYLMASLKVNEESQFQKGLATSLNSIGSIHKIQKNYEKAKECFEKSLKIREQINDKTGIANSLDEIGAIYRTQNNLAKSLEYYTKSLNIQEQIQDATGAANSLNSIGLVYDDLGDFDKALEYELKRLKIREQTKDKEGVAYSLSSIAKSLLKKGDVNQALPYASKSLILSKELGYPNNIRNSANILKQIYIQQNKYKQVLEMFELEIKMLDSTNNQQTQKATLRKQMQYEYDKKELILKAEQDKKDVIAKEELKQKEKERNYFIVGFALVLLLAIFILRGFRQKQKDNKLIILQKQLVEEKQKEILDSIHYAKKIQTALMTNENYIEKSLNKLKND